ncbi:MAG TPA: Hsp20/alpha crystallin family protein [Myxococcaceae bacterium]|nr:Hsp20/alpha crystallin family protein [Myxococcaceae bacterium]
MARLRRLQIHYERVFSEVLPERMIAAWSFPAIVPQPEWNPPTDVVETAAEWVMTLEIAGLREEEYEVLLYPEHLVVQGERPWRQLGEAARLQRAEIRWGPFHAAVRVPWRAGSIDVDRIRLQYQDGLLRIHVPKTQEGWR